MDPGGMRMLITIEGIDGSGKSSLIASLQESLKDLNPVFTREPGSTWVGEQVRRAIAEESDPVTEALLFIADHAAHLETVIRPGLANGSLIISDRYSDSRYAYQPVTLEGHIPDPLSWLRQVHNGWTVLPDLTFLLVVPVEVAIARLSGTRQMEHFEQAGVLSKVQENYLALAAAEPSRFVVIDAEKESEEIGIFVSDVIRQKSGSLRSRPRS